HIEAHSQARELPLLLKQLLRHSDDLVALPAVDARRRAAEQLARARAHFDDREDVADARDDVELAVAAAIVAHQYLEALAPQVLGRDVFRALAQLCTIHVRACARVLPVQPQLPTQPPAASSARCEAAPTPARDARGDRYRS